MQLELGKSYLGADSEQVQIVRYSESNGFFYDHKARPYFPDGISVSSLVRLKEIGVNDILPKGTIISEGGVKMRLLEDSSPHGCPLVEILDPGPTSYYAGVNTYRTINQTVLKTHVSTKAEGIDAVLEERGKRYGEFKGHAKITQELKGVMANCDNWSKLSHSQKEALEMIAHKIGRILNGDPNYADNWVDIGGYSQLIVKELENAVDTTTTSSK